MHVRRRFRQTQLAAVGIVAVIVAAPSAVDASAGPVARAVARVSLNITVDQTLASRQTIPTIVANGGTTTLSKPSFMAGAVITSTGPDPVGVHMRFELPPGLHLGIHGGLEEAEYLAPLALGTVERQVSVFQDLSCILSIIRR